MFYYSFKIIPVKTSSNMKGILHSDWLPKRPRWAHLAHSGFPVLVPQVKDLFFGHYNESLLTKLVRSRWLNVDVILFCIYIDLDKNAKKNFANIQPSWPHTWSITHMSSNLNSFRDYLLTFERLCDTCSLDYFKFFFLCLSYFASFSCFSCILLYTNLLYI